MYRMIPFIQNQSYKKFMDKHICLLYRHITCTHMNGLNTIFIPVVTSGKEEEQKSLLKGIPTVSHAIMNCPLFLIIFLTESFFSSR